MKADLSRTVQIEPDKWYRMNSPETSICCDCCMVHVTEYMLDNGKLLFRTRGDRRATNKLRKKHGITVTTQPPEKL